MNCWSKWIGRTGLMLAVSGLLLFAASGCKPKNQLQERNGNLRARNTAYLLEQMDKNAFKPDWLSVKMDVAFETPKLSDSFKMYIRMKRDSVIWLNATYYAVEVARCLITPDSIQFLDRRGSKYYKGNNHFLQDSFNLDFNFESLQAFILGNGLEMEDSVRIRSYAEKDAYMLSSVKKRQLRRAPERMLKDSELAVSNWLDPETFKVTRVSLYDLKSTRLMEGTYSNFEEVEGDSFARQIDLNIVNQGDSTKVRVKFLKVNTSGPYKMSFRVPEKYERVQ